jgi:molybdopterin molybdotransferase
VISGGVSAGVLDLVPSVLAELGVRQVFHKVHLKPGKPLWFGVWTAGAKMPASAATSAPPGGTLVFGLPGNPVSSVVSFELFVRPAIGKIAGRNNAALEALNGRLTADFVHRSDRPTYHPARLSAADGQWRVEPLTWLGSADLRTFVEANALAIFAPGQRTYRAGDSITALRLPQ